MLSMDNFHCKYESNGSNGGISDIMKQIKVHLTATTSLLTNFRTRRSNYKRFINYSSRQWIFTSHVYICRAFALLFLKRQSNCRNIIAIKTMANHGNSSNNMRNCGQEPERLSGNVFLLQVQYLSRPLCIKIVRFKPFRNLFKYVEMFWKASLNKVWTSSTAFWRSHPCQTIVAIIAAKKGLLRQTLWI